MPVQQSTCRPKEVLAENFGVSRPVCASALSRLRDDGICTVAPGIGKLRKCAVPDRELMQFLCHLVGLGCPTLFTSFRIESKGRSRLGARRRDDEDIAAMDAA